MFNDTFFGINVNAFTESQFLIQLLRNFCAIISKNQNLPIELYLDHILLLKKSAFSKFVKIRLLSYNCLLILSKDLGE